MTKKQSKDGPPEKLRKGAYRHPNGNYVTERTIAGPGRRLRIVAVHKAHPDTAALARVLLKIAERMADESNDDRLRQ